ncbi:MAG: UDP-N-acetylmuramoyl-L-alanyl-D-glutamate--2,6-diaminopimelate ligase [Acidimicrobiia bacterium]
MQLHDLLSGLEVLEVVGDPHVEVTEVTHDSRLVAPGACFACIRGETSDGHDHAPAAVESGASALLVERRLPVAVTQARVADVRTVLGPVAARCHGEPSRALSCLGITGTNGKTTATHLLEAIGQAAGFRTGLIGTLGARIAGEELPGVLTTPEASDLQALLARMRDAGVGLVAMEVSSHALVQRRVDGTRFRVACFTNLSPEHLDFHGSLEAYFEAKASLFDPTRAAAAAVNIDDPRGPVLARRATARGLEVKTFGMEGPAAAVSAEVVEAGPATRFVLRADGWRTVIQSPLIGRFNVSNSLAAAATALAAGIPFTAVADGLQAPIRIPGRLERVDAGQPFFVLVDYAHSPDALRRVLGVARGLAGDGRVLVVFGAGGDRDREKRPQMGRAVGEAADVAVLTSDNPRSEDPAAIAAAVKPGLEAAGVKFTIELDRRAAIRQTFNEAAPGDVVVIAGKGHETGQTAKGVTRPFDDRAVAREELAGL